MVDSQILQPLVDSVNELTKIQKESKVQHDESAKETQAELYKFGMIMSRVEQEIKTINIRGCVPGSTMYEDVHKRIDDRLGNIHKKINEDSTAVHAKIDREVSSVNKKIDDYKGRIWLVGSLGTIIAGAVATMMQFISGKTP